MFINIPLTLGFLLLVPPGKANIRLNNTAFNVGETVHMTCSVNTSEHGNPLKDKCKFHRDDQATEWIDTCKNNLPITSVNDESSYTCTASNIPTSINNP